MYIQRNYHKHAKQGFSLIELIVSVGIFSIVATFAIGTLLTLTNAQRKAAALQSAFDNVRFAIESMAKDMRTGTNYTCLNLNGTTSPVPGYPCPRLRYTNANGDTIDYLLGANHIQKALGGTGTPQDITSKEVYIDQLDFYLRNATTGDNIQPTLTIVVKGTAGRSRANVESKILLQTSVTPRKWQP